jgi:hypothetical protein
MTIQTAVDYTLSRFVGMELRKMEFASGTWTVEVGKDDAQLVVEMDELTQCACVLERKNIKHSTMTRFMNILMRTWEMGRVYGNEVVDEDPLPPES